MTTFTSYRIDDYQVILYGNDLDGAVQRWMAASIHFYTSGKRVGTAHFARQGQTAPDATFENGLIIMNAQGEQFERTLDLLRHEEIVYLVWHPHHDEKENNDGDAYIITKRDHVGEDGPHHSSPGR